MEAERSLYKQSEIAILFYNVIHSLLSDNVLLMFGYDLRRNLVSPSVISLSPAILSKLENSSSSLDYSHFLSHCSVSTLFVVQSGHLS